MSSVYNAILIQTAENDYILFWQKKVFFVLK